MRPLLLLAVAFFVYNITSTICLSLGVTEENTGNIAMGAMVIAAIITYMRLNRARNKK
ncbi:hypothetical protein AB6A23_04740 [Paenibacillus tarimensis]